MTSPEIKCQWVVRLSVSVVSIIFTGNKARADHMVWEYHSWLAQNSNLKLSNDTPTVVSCSIEAVVIHDDPLTLCLAPFKLQIVLHTLFRTRKDHIVLFDVQGRIIPWNRSNSPQLTQTAACSTETAHITHATSDLLGDTLNTLTWRVTKKWAWTQKASFSRS